MKRRKRRRLTIYVDEEVFQSFMNYVVLKYGKLRNALSEEAENALKEYLEKHKGNVKEK